jgi:hypothetical protein
MLVCRAIGKSRLDYDSRPERPNLNDGIDHVHLRKLNQTESAMYVGSKSY